MAVMQGDSLGLWWFLEDNGEGDANNDGSNLADLHPEVGLPILAVGAQSLSGIQLLFLTRRTDCHHVLLAVRAA